MKVVYNWLKDFVDVTASPDELASGLALSGTNIGGVEKGPHGAVIDAEVSSNRPDCLGHYGIAREVGAIWKQCAAESDDKHRYDAFHHHDVRVADRRYDDRHQSAGRQ